MLFSENAFNEQAGSGSPDEEKKPITKEVIESISGDTPLYALLELDPGIASILMASGMGCITCPASMYESLGEASAVHGLDHEQILDDIKYYLYKRHLGTAPEEASN